jgi:hypothetical protein
MYGRDMDRMDVLDFLSRQRSGRMDVCTGVNIHHRYSVADMHVI